MEDKTIKVLLADGQKLFTDSLKTAIQNPAGNIRIVGAVQNSGDTVAAAEKEHPDVLILDMHIPGAGGSRTAAAVAEKCPDTKIIMLLEAEDAKNAPHDMPENVYAFLLRNIPLNELIDIITLASSRILVVSREILVALPFRVGAAFTDFPEDQSGKPERSSSGLDTLQPREREILVCIAAGMDNKAIAERFSLAEQTIKNHISVIYTKLGIRRRSQAAELGKSLSSTFPFK
ncbi:LuxR C-terminal-related transcriptional regulator [Breznakiella homolactica]|uniref:Response regulator transcription factor n=1 Tax=Breznakiella homolactica TaxID=2798577 RepID=A0A7T8BC80_9SPIR|nr:response regulator transcription factor [Breznakiella homolactica]QQO09948.1 response regulator transcription factor [Breznakiella homolactica]